MGPEWVAIIALVALFVVGTVLPINMGALAYVAAWLVGMYSLDLDEKEILAGVSGDLILTLIGVTYLFAIAKNNGTVDLIVRSAVKAVGGRVALIPWVMFAVTAVLTAHRRGQPGRLRDHRPDRPRLRRPLQISPLMMGMIVVHGAQAGGFSPISIYGTITNSVMEERRPALQRDRDLPVQPGRQPRSWRRSCSSSLGGRKLMGQRLDPDEPGHARPRTCTAAAPPSRPAAPAPRRQTDAPRRSAYAATRSSPWSPSSASPLVALVFDKNIGFVAITAAVILGDALARTSTRTRSSRSPGRPCCWSPGVSTYATILDHRGLAGVRRQLGRRPGRGRHRRAGPLLRRRRRLGVRLLDRAAAGDHPDRGAADRRRRHQCRPVRGRAGGVARRSSTSARSPPTVR